MIGIDPNSVKKFSSPITELLNLFISNDSWVWLLWEFRFLNGGKIYCFFPWSSSAFKLAYKLSLNTFKNVPAFKTACLVVLK